MVESLTSHLYWGSLDQSLVEEKNHFWNKFISFSKNALGLGNWIFGYWVTLLTFLYYPI